MDVSKGGLAFRYIASERRRRQSSGIDILFAGASYSLQNVPFKTISDFMLPNEFSSGSATTNRYGVQFGKLTEDQIADLECFIANHTKRDV
jgi:hypothetical protein